MRDLAQLFKAKTQKIVEDTTKKLRIVEHLQVQSGCWLLLTVNIVLSVRSWPARQSTSLCGWTVIERERTLGSR